LFAFDAVTDAGTAGGADGRDSPVHAVKVRHAIVHLQVCAPAATI
jgi:hypothetical protein